MTTRLHLAHMPDLDELLALEYGRVDEGQPEESWRFVGSQIGYLRAAGLPCEVGFKVWRYATVDVELPDLRAIWGPPRFDVPMLGLLDPSAGEIILAARALFRGRASISHDLFLRAMNVPDEQAVALWQACLEAGESAAHLCLGTTLSRLGRDREAYRHLRYYTHIAPAARFAWCAYGEAAWALGLTAAAEEGFRRAIALERRSDPDTGARERLDGRSGSASQRRWWTWPPRRNENA